MIGSFVETRMIEKEQPEEGRDSGEVRAEVGRKTKTTLVHQDEGAHDIDAAQPGKSHKISERAMKPTPEHFKVATWDDEKYVEGQNSALKQDLELRSRLS